MIKKLPHEVEGYDDDEKDYAWAAFLEAWNSRSSGDKLRPIDIATAKTHFERWVDGYK